MADRPFIYPRANEDDDELRFREAINRIFTSALGTVDSVIRTRTASQDALRARSVVRARLIDAGHAAMEAFHIEKAKTPHDGEGGS